MPPASIRAAHRSVRRPPSHIPNTWAHSGMRAETGERWPTCSLAAEALRRVGKDVSSAMVFTSVACSECGRRILRIAQLLLNDYESLADFVHDDFEIYGQQSPFRVDDNVRAGSVRRH